MRRKQRNVELLFTSGGGGPAQKSTDPLLENIEYAWFLAGNIGLNSLDDAGRIEGNHYSQADTENNDNDMGKTARKECLTFENVYVGIFEIPF